MPSIIWLLFLFHSSQVLCEQKFFTCEKGPNIFEVYHFTMFASLGVVLFCCVFFMVGGEIREIYGFRGSIFSFHTKNHYSNYVWLIFSILLFYCCLVNFLKFFSNYAFCLLRALAPVADACQSDNQGSV